MNAAKLMLSAAVTSLMFFAPDTFTAAEAASVKLKPQIVKVKPKITVAKPKLRLKVRTAKIRVEPRIKIKSVTPKIAAKIRNKPAINQVTKLAGQPKPQVLPEISSTKISATASLAKRKDLTGIADAAQSVDAARIAGKASHNFAGLDIVDPKDQLVGGNKQANPGNPVGMSPDEFNTRFGNSKNVDVIGASMLGKYSNLGNRSASTPTNKWSDGLRMDLTKIGTDGIASDKTSSDGVRLSEGNSATLTKDVIGDEVTITKSWSSEEFPSYVDVVRFEAGRVWTREIDYVDADGHRWRDWENFETGVRQIYRDGELEAVWNARDLNRTKTGDEHADAAPPPNCGSVNCNSRRNGYSLRKKAKDGTHADPGPDGALPTTEATNVTHFINRDDLVKNGVAETGTFAGFGGGYGRLKNGGVRY